MDTATPYQQGVTAAGAASCRARSASECPLWHSFSVPTRRRRPKGPGGGQFVPDAPPRQVISDVPLTGPAAAGGATPKDVLLERYAHGDRDFTSMDLTDADLRYVNCPGADFTNANCPGADFTGADFTNANFTNANFTGVDYTGPDDSAELIGMSFAEAYESCLYHTGANFAGACLSGAGFTAAHLRWANFAGADLSGAYLAGADLRNADLRGANFTDANFTNALLAGGGPSRRELHGCHLHRRETRGGATLRRCGHLRSDGGSGPHRPQRVNPVFLPPPPRAPEKGGEGRRALKRVRCGRTQCSTRRAHTDVPR